MLKLSRAMPRVASVARTISFSSPASRGALSKIDPSLTGMATNLVRDMEREFDTIRNRMNNRFNMLSPWADLMPSPWTFSILEPWQEIELPSSLIKTDKDGNRKFELSLNLREFKPEDIKVKTVGQNIVVSAKTEKKDENEYYLREFSQSYRLPKDLKLEELKSKITDDGVLVCDAPLPKMSEIPETEEKVIPIEHEKLTQLK